MTRSRAVGRPSQKNAILEASLQIIRDGEQVSMDSAARAVGLTKPGLMYHFPDKEKLVTALVDHVLDGYEQRLTEILGEAGDSPQNKLRAYVTWAITGRHDPADLVMMCDPRLMQQMAERWGERMTPWFAIPAATAEATRTRWRAARFIADGAWFNAASGMPHSDDRDQERLLELAIKLIEGTTPL